jgi:hypothetical protein
MRHELRSKKMASTREASWYRDLTVEQARAMRVDEARSAALYADKAEQAQAAGQCSAMAHWITEYRRATTRCRRLGERLRDPNRALRVVRVETHRPISRPAARPDSAASRTGKAA